MYFQPSCAEKKRLDTVLFLVEEISLNILHVYRCYTRIRYRSFLEARRRVVQFREIVRRPRRGSLYTAHNTTLGHGGF